MTQKIKFYTIEIRDNRGPRPHLGKQEYPHAIDHGTGKSYRTRFLEDAEARAKLLDEQRFTQWHVVKEL